MEWEGGMKSSGKRLSLEVFVCWPCEGLKTLPNPDKNHGTCGTLSQTEDSPTANWRAAKGKPRK